MTVLIIFIEDDSINLYLLKMTVLIIFIEDDSINYIY